MCFSNEDETPLIDSSEEIKSSSDKQFTIFRFGLLLVIMICYTSSYIAFLPVTQQYVYLRFLLQRDPEANSSDLQTSDPCLKVRANNSGLSIPDLAQEDASTFTIYLTVTTSVPGTITTLLLGSYSDIFGRRVLLLLPFTCSIIKIVIFCFVTAFDLSVYLLLAGSFIEGVSGSVFSAFLACYAYTADISSAGKQRTILIAIVEGATGFFAAVLQFSVGYAILSYGFLYPVIATGIFTFTSVILLIFLPETVSSKREKSQRDNLSPVRHLVNVCKFYKPKASNVKYILCLLSMLFFTTTIVGRLIIEPLYQLNKPLCWNSLKIGIYGALRLIVQNVFGVFCIKLMHSCLGDVSIVIIGLVSGLVSFLVEGFASEDWIMYIVPALGVLGMTPYPGLRATMAAMAPPDEIGTIFSSVAAVETVTQTIAALALSLVYKVTLSVLSGAVFFIMAGFTLVSILMMVLLKLRLKLEQSSPVF